MLPVIKSNGFVLQESNKVVLVMIDIDTTSNNESMNAEPSQMSRGVWISPYSDCTTKDMTLVAFPEFRNHSVFSVSAVNSGRSIAVCLVLGDVFA